MSDHESEAVEHVEFVYSSTNRILHWVRAAMITGLAITGFYIAKPFLAAGHSSDQLIFGQWVYWHLVFGFILIAGALLRIYLFFFGTNSTGELLSLKDVSSLHSWKIALKSYFFIGELNKKGMYGPLHFMSYFMITVFIVMASVTGLILYVHTYHQGLGGMFYELMRVLEYWMGGLAMVRMYHHITMWGFLIFIPIHIYMVVWSAIRFRHAALDVMFTGYDYHLVKDKHKKNVDK